MPLAVYTHPAMLDHRPSEGHVERPARLTAVLEAFGSGFDRPLETLDAPSVDGDDLRRVHDDAFLDDLARRSPLKGVVRIDADTQMSPGSLDAARRAAGAVTAAVRAVMAGEISRAFCAVRPPGHHAGPDFAMGFCLYSNVAIGAKLALTLGARRVAIVDFDVHHGNGTQSVVERDAGLFFASVHESPNYPGTGGADETGIGNVINTPVPPGATRKVWRAAFERLVEGVDAFAPDLVMISAGFDAHIRDPLSNQALEAEDYAWATRAVAEAARLHCGGRIVSSLEGGYDLTGLAESALSHVGALRGE